MNDFNKHSRLNKFEKRRQNTKLTSILMVIASILLIILIAIWIFGGKDKKPAEIEVGSPNTEEENNESEKNDDETKGDEEAKETEETEEDTSSEADSEADETTDDNEKEEDSTETGAEEDKEVDTEQAEPSDDNVVEAYTGDWQPVGTEQSEPHTTTYNDQDRNEMEQAIRLATDLDDMITWWLGNGGEQKVIATVSDKKEIEIYRVYLSWIANEGWQPTKVEVLKVNDKGKKD